MPAASQRQRAWAFAVKGPAWAKRHHFDTPGKLPARAGKGKALEGARKRKRKR